MKWKKTSCLLLAAVVWVTGISASATSVKSLQNQKSQNEKELKNIQSQISGLEGKKNALSNEVNGLNDDLTNTLLNIEVLESDLADKEVQIEEAQIAFEEAKATEEQQYEAMKLRIQYLYESGNVGYMELLLTSDSVADLMNKVDYAEELQEYDNRLLDEYKAAKQAVIELQARLEEEKEELLEMQAQLEEEKANLEAMIARKRSEIANFDSQLSAARARVSEYQQKIKEQNAQIRKLQEEEARRAAAARAAKNAAKPSQDNNGNGGNADAGTVSSKDEGGSAGSGSSGGSSSGGGSSGGSSGGGSSGGRRRSRRLHRVLRAAVCGASLCVRRQQPDRRNRLFRIRQSGTRALWNLHAPGFGFPRGRRPRSQRVGDAAGRCGLLLRSCGNLHRRRPDRPCQHRKERHQGDQYVLPEYPLRPEILVTGKVSRILYFL